MAKIPVIFLVLLGAFFTKNVICLDFCGAEDIPKCKQDDEDCVKSKLEPGLRKLMIKNQPGYFMEQVDPMIFDALPVKTNKGVYTLKNVKLTGFSDAQFIETKPDFVNNTFKYSYLYKFELVADDFIDQNGKTLLDKRPLIIHLDNLKSTTKTNFVIVKRCEKEHIKFTDSTVAVTHFDGEKNFILKSGLRSADLDLKQAIGQTVGKSATKKVALNFRTLVTIAPISAFYL